MTSFTRSESTHPDLTPRVAGIHFHAPSENTVVGPGRCCSPRHIMSCNSRKYGPNCMSPSENTVRPVNGLADITHHAKGHRLTQDSMALYACSLAGAWAKAWCLRIHPEDSQSLSTTCMLMIRWALSARPYTTDGMHYPLEMHIVHATDEGRAQGLTLVNLPACREHFLWVTLSGFMEFQ